MGHILDTSPSRLGMLTKCLRSGDRERRAERLTKWAESGTVLGRVAEIAEIAGWEDALATVPAHLRSKAEAFDLDALRRVLKGGRYSWGAGAMWCPTTGQGVLLGTGMTHETARSEAEKRVRQLEGDWLVGVADLAGVVTIDGVVWLVVPDLKMGWEQPPSGAECLQTRAYTVMLTAALNAMHVPVRAAKHGCLWMPDGQKPRWVEPEELDSVGLLDAEIGLRDLLAESERVQALPLEQRPPPRYGEHCTYCPHTHHCNALTAQLQRFQPGNGALEITRENAREVYARISTVEAMCKQATDALRVFAQKPEDAFPAGGGRVFGPYRAKSTTIDPLKLYDVLSGMGLADKAAEIMGKSVSVSKDELIEATKDTARDEKGKLPRGAGKALEEKLMGALKSAGAITETVEIKVGSHWPGQSVKPELPAGKEPTS